MRTIQSNIYYQMVKKGMCKFGNDYALGLKWLRHLGYVQVSTNPVLAAIAYNDDPELWDEFLRRYDAYLTWGYSNVSETGRPNIVFKVAGVIHPR